MPLFGVDLKITDDGGKELPRDGKAFGHLMVRGLVDHQRLLQRRGRPGAAMRAAGSTTGDVATLDPEGFMQITDRAKDVIKSGGEWISSIELENLAVGHPDVAEAAVIGVAPSQVGRAAAAGHRAASQGNEPDQGGADPGLSRRQDRQVVDARRRRQFAKEIPAHRHG